MRGTGWSQPRPVAPDPVLSYLSPVKSRTAAKVCGRGKRYTAKRSRRWKLQIATACAQQLR